MMCFASDFDRYDIRIVKAPPPENIREMGEDSGRVGRLVVNYGTKYTILGKILRFRLWS